LEFIGHNVSPDYESGLDAALLSEKP